MNGYGTLVEPATLRIERLLPGPAERIWSWLTDSDLRRQWLGAGVMELTPGAPFELVWRNDELTDPPGAKPEGFGSEHRLESHIITAEPPHRLVFAWFGEGEVSFELTPRGAEVLLTVTHRRLSDRHNMLMVGAGWHAHLDVLVARVAGREPAPFWDAWVALREEYDRLLPA